MTQSKLNPSCRVALAALLHDLGKFAERARIDVDRDRLETWKQLDCPHWDGRPSHIHAAYTTGAAARHHRPDTPLQWLIATADRLASGFERSEFETYNKAAEGTRTGRNHYQARLLTLFDAIGLEQDRHDAQGPGASPWQYSHPSRCFQWSAPGTSPVRITPRRTNTSRSGSTG